MSLLFFSMIWLISIILALPLFTASDIHLIFENSECGITLLVCHEQNEIWQEVRFWSYNVLFIKSKITRNAVNVTNLFSDANQ